MQSFRSYGTVGVAVLSMCLDVPSRRLVCRAHERRTLSVYDEEDAGTHAKDRSRGIELWKDAAQLRDWLMPIWRRKLGCVPRG